MKAVDFYIKNVKPSVEETQSFSEIATENTRIKNLLGTLIRKLTTQSQRLIPFKVSSFKKIKYFAKSFGVDYLEYILINNPDIPYEYYPKKDFDEIDYFLTMMLLSAVSDGFYEKEFENKRWTKFETIRKHIGKKLKFNLLNNRYELLGFKSIVYPDTGIFPDNYKLKTFKEKKNRICFDVGAYIGDSSYAIYKEFKPKKIYAFEPSNNNLKVLKSNLELNNLTELVETVNCATGDENKEVRFIEGGASSTFKEAKNSEKINMIKLDDFVIKHNIKNVNFIKMDIEGAEFDTLKGAENIIRKNKPDMIIAIYHKGEHFFQIPKYLKKIVPSYNFRFLAFSGSSPIIERFVAVSVDKI